MMICQSCGRAITHFGTHGDGHPDSDFCIDCYKDGKFVRDCQENPRLKRWMPVIDKASWILDRSGYAVLATLDDEGYPRPAAMDILHHEEIRTLWLTTFRSSEKARHILRDPRAGLSFVHEADSVSLTGKAELITERSALLSFWDEGLRRYFPSGLEDSDYCLIRFTARSAVFYIDGEKSAADLLPVALHIESE